MTSESADGADQYHLKKDKKGGGWKLSLILVSGKAVKQNLKSASKSLKNSKITTVMMDLPMASCTFCSETTAVRQGFAGDVRPVDIGYLDCNKVFLRFSILIFHLEV